MLIETPARSLLDDRGHLVDCPAGRVDDRRILGRFQGGDRACFVLGVAMLLVAEDVFEGD